MSIVKAIALASFAVLAPIHTVMLVAGILIAADLLSGMVAAHKRGEPISSAALRRTVTKICVYQAALVLSFITEHFMLGDSIPLVKLAAAAMSAVELKSILENLNEINGSNLFAGLIASLGSKNDSAEK